MKIYTVIDMHEYVAISTLDIMQAFEKMDEYGNVEVWENGEMIAYFTKQELRNYFSANMP